MAERESPRTSVLLPPVRGNHHVQGDVTFIAIPRSPKVTQKWYSPPTRGLLFFASRGEVMKLNRLLMVSLVGISLSTPAFACEHSTWGGILSFFHHDDCDHDKDKGSHQDQNHNTGSHGDCSGGGHSGGGSSSSGGSGSGGSGNTSSGPSKGSV